MNVEPYPYRVRAWWGDVVVADSAACLCVERDGEPAVLFFPPAAIELGRFEDAGRLCPVPGAGEARRWSIDGQDVLALVDASGPRPLAGHGTFDPVRTRVEVLDAGPDSDERDVTVKRFPTWGDAAHLLDLLDVRPDSDLRYLAMARSDGRRPVVEGSQMLAQSIVAAGRHAPGRRAVSAGMMFLRPADARRPLAVELTELSAGRTFTGLAVQVTQDGRCCAAGTVLLDATAADVVRHEPTAPAVPGPYDCPPFDMGVTGRDLRVVEGAYSDDADAPAGPPVIDAWVRFRDVPDDPVLHAGLLAQFTGHMSIAAALRPHVGIGQSQAHRTVSMGINAISLSLHADVRADRWLLYHHAATFAGNGMTHAECRAHGEDGELVASFVVDAMVRPFADGGERDGRTAL